MPLPFWVPRKSQTSELWIFVVRGCTNPYFKELIGEQQYHRSHTMSQCDGYNKHLPSLPPTNAVPTFEQFSHKLSWPIFQLNQECTMHMTFCVTTVQWFAWHFSVIIAQTLFNWDVLLLFGQEKKFKV